MPNKTTYDIHERIFYFVVDVIKFVKPLSRTVDSEIIIKQIIRSVTSMGANDQEADGALTKKEFVHRYSIVRKEGKETIFWLKLIGALDKTKYKKTEILKKEGLEIVAIVSTIISKANRKGMRK